MFGGGRFVAERGCGCGWFGNFLRRTMRTKVEGLGMGWGRAGDRLGRVGGEGWRVGLEERTEVVKAMCVGEEEEEGNGYDDKTHQ